MGEEQGSSPSVTLSYLEHTGTTGIGEMQMDANPGAEAGGD